MNLKNILIINNNLGPTASNLVVGNESMKTRCLEGSA